MNGQTKLSALALPLALLALVQVGSCGGGARGGSSNRRAGSASAAAVQNTPANRNAGANANTNKNANGARNTNANTNANSGANANANRERDEREDGSTVSKEEGAARGSWGGRGAQLDVEADGARIEFDCAHGRMENFTADADGRFDVRGVFVAERGGPVRVDEKEVEQPARYSGKIEGQTMTLTVTLDGDESGALSFTLTRGRGARIMKCR